MRHNKSQLKEIDELGYDILPGCFSNEEVNNLRKARSKGSIHNDGVYDQDETHRILQACDQIKEQYPFQAESLKFMRLTGQRKEQIVKLKTSDIDMVNKIIILN